MIKVECMTPQEPSAMTKAVNDKITSLVSTGYEVLNVYPMTIGDSRYVSVVISYETNPQPAAEFVTIDSLNGTLATYAKKTDIPSVPTRVSQLTNDSGYIANNALTSYAKKSELPTVPTKVSQLTNDSGYITKSTADGLYEPKATGV